jgi:phosphoribosylformylglycinamidine synthase
VDKVTTTLKPAKDEHVFAVELLPGQYDQREDFAAQCIQLITQKEKPVVAAAKVYVLKGKLSKDVAKIKHYCINPVEAREAALEVPKTLEETLTEPGAVAKMTGFLKLTKKQVAKLQQELGLAMSVEDLLWCQTYFKKLRREPTITEIRVLDTYWSDHCRHTTFMTCLDKVEIADGSLILLFRLLLPSIRLTVISLWFQDTKRPMTLMDLASIITKKLKKQKLVLTWMNRKKLMPAPSWYR